MSNNSTHYFRPYAKAMLERSNPDMSQERQIEERQREGDRRLVRAIALAIQNGEHLPARKPVHPIFAVWDEG